MNGPRWRFLVVVAVVAFAVRLAAVLAMRDIHAGTPRQTGGADATFYDTLGQTLASGQGYTFNHLPTAFRAPGFPLFLAGVDRLSGHNYPAAYLALCIVGALCCVLTYGLAAELTPERTARLAAALAIVYTPHIYLATIFYSENLFTLLGALGLWLFIRHLKNQSMPALATAALVLGFSTLVRPFALLLLPILLVVLMMNGAARWKRAILFAALFIVPILPWTIRNELVMGKPILLTTNGGSTFYGANNDRVLSEWPYLGGWISTEKLPGRQAINAAPDEIKRDQVEWRLGIQWARAHATSLPRLMLYKFLRLWLPDMASENSKYVVLQCVTYTPFLLLFIAGLFACARRPSCATPQWLALHGSILATVLMSLVFWGSPRFRDANAPLLMVYAALGAQTLAVVARNLRGHVERRPDSADRVVVPLGS